MHHRVSKEYARVYYPFLPVIALLITGIVWAVASPRALQQQVLGKAMSLSQQTLLQETNEERQVKDLSALALNADLARAAQAKAEDMVRRNYWSHNTPDGSPPWVFIADTSYSYQKAGENLAFGFADSDTTVRAWMNSTGHRANILDSAYQEVGFGYADSDNFDDKGPSTVVVAMYGRPLLAGPAENSGNENAPNSNAQSNVLNAPATTASISQVLSNSPLLGALAIAIMSAALGIWAGSHMRQVKRIIKHGESLVLHHPVLDIVVLSTVLIAAVLNQTAGFIR